MNWKLIALDMDGTLLGAGGTVSDMNKQALADARQAGVEFTLTTGRHRTLVTPFLPLLDLQVPFVTSNGSEVWSPNGELLSRSAFTHEQFLYLRNAADERGFAYWPETDQCEYTHSCCPKEAASHTWIKFVVDCGTEAGLQELRRLFEQDGRFELSSAHRTKLDINPKGISKASGLAVVCSKLSLRPEQVIAMGDGLNDAEMLCWAGIGVAMGNASDEVKRCADKVTANNTEHGVALAIRELLQLPAQ